jgi:hypothetical protein
MTEPSLSPEMMIQTTRHAVYRCYSDLGELLYVGTTGHLGRRLAAHAEKIWFLQVRGITLEWYPDEFEARVCGTARYPRGAPEVQRGSQEHATSQRDAAEETKALILKYVAEGHSGSRAGIMAGRTSSYGRMIVRLDRAAKKEPAGGERTEGDMS